MLCAPLYLAYEYWKTVGEGKIFTSDFKNAVIITVNVFRTEQDHSKSLYTFERVWDKAYQENRYPSASRTRQTGQSVRHDAVGIPPVG